MMVQEAWPDVKIPIFIKNEAPSTLAMTIGDQSSFISFIAYYVKFQSGKVKLPNGKEIKVLVLKEFIFHKFRPELEPVSQILDEYRLVTWIDSPDQLPHWSVPGKIINLMKQNNCESLGILKENDVFMIDGSIKPFLYGTYSRIERYISGFDMDVTGRLETVNNPKFVSMVYKDNFLQITVTSRAHLSDLEKDIAAKGGMNLATKKEGKADFIAKKMLKFIYMDPATMAEETFKREGQTMVLPAEKSEAEKKAAKEKFNTENAIIRQQQQDNSGCCVML